MVRVHFHPQDDDDARFKKFPRRDFPDEMAFFQDTWVLCASRAYEFGAGSSDLEQPILYGILWDLSALKRGVIASRDRGERIVPDFFYVD